jgi:hypothetical protein
MAQVRIGASLREQKSFSDAIAWLEAGIATLRKVPITSGPGAFTKSRLSAQLNEAFREIRRATEQR